jgi:D-alanine-D-alanine ligase
VSGPQRVAVLKGGRSMEREVSLRSGANVEAALRRLGHEVIPVDADPSLVRTLRAERPDVVFVAMHGKGGEDGTVQELLEILDIRYTGSGVQACARAMDKVMAKAVFASAGIATPPAFAFGESAFRELGAADALMEIETRLGLPLVVKPAKQGSALGISVAREPNDVPRALMTALSFDDHVLLEQFVGGREIAVTVLGTDDPEALPAVEAVLTGDFYDFEARYTPGMTELVAPADLHPGLAEEVSRIALACYAEIGCRGFGRVDMIIDADEQVWVLEINAIPGMTDTSLLPKAAMAAGLSFDDVIARVLADASLGG